MVDEPGYQIPSEQKAKLRKDVNVAALERLLTMLPPGQRDAMTRLFERGAQGSCESSTQGSLTIDGEVRQARVTIETDPLRNLTLGDPELDKLLRAIFS